MQAHMHMWQCTCTESHRWEDEGRAGEDGGGGGGGRETGNVYIMVHNQIVHCIAIGMQFLRPTNAHPKSLN